MTIKISYEAGEEPKKAKCSGSAIVVWRVARACSTKWITRLRLKQTLFFFYYFPKTPKRRKGWLQSISRFPRRGRNEKFNVNNALICEFRFNSGDMNVSMG